MQQKDIDYVIQAHQDYPRKPSKAYRKWDQKTPYFMHPLWCASTISTETTLDAKIREEGILTLLYHDILEDTTRALPHWLSKEVQQSILNMTFQGGMSQEIRDIWNKEPKIRLYKLFDKVSNLLDGSWMDAEKRRVYGEYTQQLRQDVEQHYGILNITRIAERIINI